MPGLIDMGIFYSDKEEPDAVAGGISAFEAQQQLQALEAQAATMGKYVLVTVHLLDRELPPEVEEDDSPDTSEAD